MFLKIIFIQALFSIVKSLLLRPTLNLSFPMFRFDSHEIEAVVSEKWLSALVTQKNKVTVTSS